jgi:hypothetical protein
VQNVERLEERAERMSMGSDIGEEIRKLQLEQKLSDSRRSSILSTDPDHPPRSRNVSTGSFSNSIVEVNSAARYGSYSPSGFMRSPIGSMRSGSWSHVSHSASLSRASRLGVVSSNPDSGDGLVHSPTADLTIHASMAHERTPRALSTESSYSNLALSANMDKQQKRASRLPSDGSFTDLYNQLTETNGSAAHLAAARIPSDTSFTDIYDQIAGEIRDHLDSPREASTSVRKTSPQRTPVGELSRQLGAALSSPPATPEHSDDHPPPPPLHTSFHLVRNSNIPEPASEEPKKAPALAPPIELDSKSEKRDFDPFDGHDPHDRPPTAASVDTFTQAQTLFRDFDGAHYAPSIRQSIMEEVDEDEFEEDEARRSSLVRVLPQPETRLPPPAEGMVYYPAPVPRMLNLPKRLSQAPPAAEQARRRTQMLDALPSAVRNSVPWLGKEQEGGNVPSAGGNLRESRLNLASVPPQLRASLFFEHAGTGRPEVSVREGSAVATFEDLLDASAKAPVSAFTDHPFAGHVGGNVYRKEAASRSSVSLQRALEKKDKGRSSFHGLRRSSVSSANALEEGRKTPSRLQKRKSQGSSMNLDDAALARGPDGEIVGDGRQTPLRHSQRLDENGEPLDEDSASLEDEEGDFEGEDEDEDEDEETYFGPPTTLLAELALRKREQKSRNRNAFTSFPNGMHSTLLELDAVAQLEKSKRKKTRVALAWEDPNLRAAEDAAGDDDDVPLGVLYKDKSSKVKSQLRDHGLADWDRPLGLIEKREMEDNEPLSRRRNRLLGVQPNRNTMAPSIQMNAAAQDAAADASSEDEGETLAQRVRRLRDKKNLDAAIGTDERPVSTAFTTEMLGQFGMEDPELKNLPVAAPQTDGKASPAPVPPSRMQTETPDEEETLGQRRARLQRENLQGQKLQPPQHKRRTSQMSIGADTTVNRASQLSYGAEQNMANRASQASLGLQQNLDPRASQILLQEEQMQQSQPPLRVSRSMADLLAAHPVGNNQPRKVSNELLVSLLPPDSLLAKHEEHSNGRKAQLQATNRRSSTMMVPGQKPFIDVPDVRPSNNRRKSGGFKGGIYNNGAGVASQQQQIPMVDPNVHMYQAPMMGYGMPMGMMSSPNLMMPYGQQQMPMMPFGAMSNPNLMQGMNGLGAMSNPNLVAGGGYTYPHPRNATFGATPQQLGEPAIDNKTRERVDAWIQGVPS